MEQRRRWADITDEEVDTLWAAAPRAAGLPRAVAPRRPRRRPPRAARQQAHMTGAIYGNLLRLYVWVVATGSPDVTLRQNLQVYLQQHHLPNYAAPFWVWVWVFHLRAEV